MMEAELRMPKRLDGLIGKRKPSADSTGRIASVMESGPLREMLPSPQPQTPTPKIAHPDRPGLPNPPKPGKAGFETARA
jgi:hypothetical protein